METLKIEPYISSCTKRLVEDLFLPLQHNSYFAEYHHNKISEFLLTLNCPDCSFSTWPSLLVQRRVLNLDIVKIIKTDFMVVLHSCLLSAVYEVHTMKWFSDSNDSLPKGLSTCAPFNLTP